MIAKELHSVFMPENLCAACDAHHPRIFSSFYDRNESPDEATQLGFCCRICQKRFCAGIKALATGV